MDSRFLRNTILVSLLFMLTIFAVVLYSNGMGPGQKQESKPVAEEVTSQLLEGQIGDDLYGWMSDDSFFEEEETEEEAGEGESLSLIATSVEKDLRIQIVDEEGKTVEGQFFKILVNETDEYRDLDRDGIIYIGEMDSGEYKISLAETEGYIVPAAPLPVTVKSRVEYVAIGDISLLIKTEQEVDALAEDGERAAATEAVAGTTQIRTRDNAVFGIDVSRWNEAIDWAQVKEQGVGFAIIRAGYRGSVTGSLVEDWYFKQNIKGATEAGIPVGIYFFTQAVNQVEAVEEASMVLELCKEYDLTYPIFIDTEGAGGEGRADNLDVQTRTAVCEAFCETIRNSGYQGGIYASKNWYNNRLDTSRLPDDIVIWLAEYADAPSYDKKYHMWQYSSSGRIPGIEGRVDMNLSFLELEE
ncbi:MAG: glycoside hydrolase family 25 protein [Lachnospiraceae bacterium]|nr:glycoside hydrolase family 25 protein [Lachnospiraceae bacterium]